MAQGKVAPILGFCDVRKAAEYYRDVLGFSERSVTPTPCTPSW